MKTRHTSILLLLWALLFSIPLSAQDMTVRSMIHDPLDQTANLSENMYKDNNGEYGGLVKVMLAAPNAKFEGWVLHQEQHNASEYWVVLAKGSNRLKIIVDKYLPLEVDFRKYDDCIIQSRHTYVLTITLPQLGQIQQDDGMRYLAMTVEPKNATVLVNGNPQQVDSNGEVSILLPKGRPHRYQVLAPGYTPKEGTVEVGDDNNTLSIRLVSTQATLRVECATKGVQVFINNVQKGTAPWSGLLAPNIYQVEARLDGYRSQKQTVTLAENDNKVINIPALQMIAGRLNVDYRPIGSEVYVDGKMVGASPNIFRNVAVGNRSVEIRKEGYETFSQTVTVKDNEQTDLTGLLKAKVAPTASAQTTTTQTGTSSSTAQPLTNSSSFSSNRVTINVNGITFTMVRVEGGKYRMGAMDQDKEADVGEKPAHDVILSTFYIGETEVTQALWQAVMGENPSIYKEKPNNPVDAILWDDCQEFIKKLNEMTGLEFRLPTDAEWEYAARGGKQESNTLFAGSNNIESVAWYRGNAFSDYTQVRSSEHGTHPVKKKSPNELGLFDMTGNVYEWCADVYKLYTSSTQTNPLITGKGQHVYRGGAFFSPPEDARITARRINPPGGSGFGLRLAHGLNPNR